MTTDLRRRAWIGVGGPAGDLGDPGEAWPGPDWLPVDVRPRRPEDAVPGAPRHVVDWVLAPGLRPCAPFLDQDVDQLLDARPPVVSTGVGVLMRVPEGLPVRGVVAHVSRCGSTLVAQWLAASPRALVLSEPSVLDVVLRLTGLPGEQHRLLVRGAVRALAQQRAAGVTAAFVKLDAWSAVALPLVRAALPGARVLALARDPVEVLVSGLRQRGAHLVPGALPPALLGLDPDVPLPPEEHGAQVVATLLSALLDGGADGHLDARGLPAARARVLALLGGEQVPDLDRVSARHAKSPGQPWVDDRADKQAAASPALRAAVARRAEPLHRRFLAVSAAEGWPA